MRLKPWMQSLLLGCFFLSGLSGLIYEVTWTRMLALQLGSTTLSVSISLSAYLGGLALGATLLGRIADRITRPALAYGAVEVAIGLYGAGSLWILSALGPTYIQFHTVWSFPEPIIPVFQLGLVGLALLFPTMLMGGTLPILIRTDPSGLAGLGARVSRFYAANTAGAVVGTALTGFVLLPQLGMRRSLWTAAALNLVLGTLVLLISQKQVVSATAEAESLSPPMRPDLPSQDVPSSRVLKLVVFASGFCALYYEVVWTRALDLIIGSTTQAFALMLTTFLVGLSAGIILGGWMIRRRWSSSFALGVVQLLVGASIFLAGQWLQDLPVWFFALFARFGENPLWFALGKAGLCGVVLLLPATLMGTVFPMAVGMRDCARNREGSQVGRYYSLNTVGCIAGACLAGLVMVPLLGMRSSFLVGVWLNMGLASLLWFSSGRRLSVKPLIPLVAAGVLTFLAPPWNSSLLTSGVYANARDWLKHGLARSLQIETDALLVYYREGPVGTVTVKEYGARRVLSIDGRAEGAQWASSQWLLGHTPFAAHQSIRDVFIIGMGTGSTAGSVAQHPVRRVEVVEIEPAVIEASKLFDSTNHRPLEHPRVQVRIGDARTILAATAPNAYDLILSQPSTPWVAGASKLFTVEFYRQARARLRPGGLMGQWVQLWGLDYPSVLSLLKTFTTVFPETLVFHAGTISEEILLLGFVDRASLSWPALQDLYGDPVFVEDLSRIDFPTAGTLLLHFLLGPQELERLTRNLPVNTDDNGLLEFAAAGSLYRDTTGANLGELQKHAVSPLQYVTGITDGPDRRMILLQMAEAAGREKEPHRGLALLEEAFALGESSQVYRVKGDLLSALGRNEEAVTAWRRALNLDRSNRTAMIRVVRHFAALPEAARPGAFRAWCAQLPDERQACLPTTTAIPR